MYQEIFCIDDDHYLHVGDNAHGRPCNSSIGPDDAYDDYWECDELEDPVNGWRCIGCGRWWREMPDLEPEGLCALKHMRHEEE